MGQVKFDVKLNVIERGRKAPQYTIDSDINGDVSLKDFVANIKLLLQTIALEVLKEEQARGFTKTPVTVVDNKRSKSLLEVDPFGKIEFLAPQAGGTILEEVWNGIISRSKIVTGQYVESHRVVYNNQQVAANTAEFMAWAKKVEIKPGDVVKFINVAPYARKLERLGVTAQRTPPPAKRRRVKSTDKKLRSADAEGKILAPNGVYFLTQRAIARKYGKNADIKLLFIPGSSLGLSGTFKTFRGSGRGAITGKEKANPRTYLYPTIQIKFFEGGTL